MIHLSIKLNKRKFDSLFFFVSRFLDVVLTDELKLVDFFDALKYLARNTVGREIAWDYYRQNYQQLDGIFGFENQAIGQLLIDISSTFENEFLFFEVCSHSHFDLSLSFICAVCLL